MIQLYEFWFKISNNLDHSFFNTKSRPLSYTTTVGKSLLRNQFFFIKNIEKCCSEDNLYIKLKYSAKDFTISSFSDRLLRTKTKAFSAWGYIFYVENVRYVVA